MTGKGRVLVLGYGNPGRRDDGLGPAVASRVERAGLPGVEATWDYQPNVEHAADIAGHDVVVFVDASISGPEPYALRPLEAGDASCGCFSTHVARPEAVLGLARDALGWAGRAYMMGVRGWEFDAFEESLSGRAGDNLREAARDLIGALSCGGLSRLVTDAPADHTPFGGAPCRTASG